MKIFRLFVAFALICIALSQRAQGVVPPPPGGYPNFTTAAGDNALQALTLGLGNTAIGTFSLFSVTTGNFNTAVGAGALDLNQADSNTATGAAALLFNTSGTENTANGAAALEFNTIGSRNTANGAFALFNNTEGILNTSNGARSLFSNTTGNFNTAIGAETLKSNTTGDDNTAIGHVALFANTEGPQNTAIGSAALASNTTGGANAATGESALFLNTTGSRNTAIGEGALLNNTTGDNNTALGRSAGLSVITADGVTCLGAFVQGADVSNTTWIGNVYGVTTQSGTTAPVVVSDSGQLGTIASSERFKKDIAGMENASDAILSLRPVTFHYKTDSTGTPQFGLIAEEVAKVNPALVLPDKEGKPYTVRYDAVNAMLLNEFLKEHRTVQEQQKEIDVLKTELQEQRALIQRVSTQLELNKPAPQTVLNNH